MTSYIIVSSDKELAKKEIDQFCTQQSIDVIDQTFVEPISKKDGTTSSLGISDVKLVQQKVAFKPIKSITKAVIIPDSQLLTIPAQNALLKLLEEPPDNTLLFLITTKLDALLPTIQSRCSIRKLSVSHASIPEEEKRQLIHQVTLFQSQSLGDSLKIAEQLAKDKGKALAWIEKTSHVVREELEQTLDEKEKAHSYAFLLTSLQETHRDLQVTNANARLLLEKLFLSNQAKNS